MTVDIFTTNEKYGIVYTDPPWPQKKGGTRKCRPNQGRALDYQTESLEEIKRIHREALEHTEEHHDVFMWTIDKFLHEAQAMMEELGYELHARIIWDKENGVAPAFTVRYSHEYLLWFYKKGKMLKPVADQRGKWTTVLREKATFHSAKPTIAYQMLEAMFPSAKKVELFARRQRDGWDCWGNEAATGPVEAVI